MKINYILVPLVFVLGFLFSFDDKKTTRLLYIILCSVILLIIASLRSAEWFTATYHIDSLVYKHYFEDAISLGWGEIESAFKLRYFYHADEFDIGYIALCKLIGVFTTNFYVFSIIADLLFFVPFAVVLYRFTTSIWQVIFAYVFYLALVQTYLFAGGRQMFAIGFDMMSLLAMIDKKKALSFVLLLLGVTLHMSSLLFVLPLIMIAFGIRPRTLKIIHVVCFFVFPFVLLFPNELINFMGDFLGMEKYSNYGASDVQGGALTFIILIEMLSLFCMVAIKKNDLARNESMKSFYVMAPLFTLFAPLIHSNGTMDRITLYFYLYASILVPYGIDCLFYEKDKKVTYLLAIGALAFLSLVNSGPTYYFFWQK